MFAAFLLRLSRSSRRRPAPRTPRFVPQLLRLEDRTLPSTFTVMNLNDSGPGSLRAAIASGDDTIAFAKGLHGTITLTSGELLDHQQRDHQRPGGESSCPSAATTPAASSRSPPA